MLPAPSSKPAGKEPAARMIVCLVVWMWAGAVCWLLGRAALGALEPYCAPGPRPAWPVEMLVGLATASTIAALGSLIGGVGPASAVGITVVALAVGALGLPGVLRALRRPRPLHRSRPSFAVLLLGGLAVGLALVQTVQPILLFDTGSYHLQAIRWIQRYGAVPGLANLHHRFAFGDGWSVAQALFDPEQLVGVQGCVLGGLVFAAAALHFLCGLPKGARTRVTDAAGKPGEVSAARALPNLAPLLRLACLPAAFWLFRRNLPSASPDAVAALLGWTAMLVFVDKVEAGTAAELDTQAVAIAVLATFATEVKLATAPLLLLPAWSIARNLRRETRRALLVAAIVAAILLPFLARSWVLSGYVQFPVAATRLPGADWTMPAANLAEARRIITDFARDAHFMDHPPLRAAQWVPIWWHDRLTPVERGALTALPLLALLHLALAFYRKRYGGAPLWPAGYGLLVATTLIGTVLWFASAPDPRFGWAFFPFLALLLGIPLAARPLHRLPALALPLLLALVLTDQARRVLPGAAFPAIAPTPPPHVATAEHPFGGYVVRTPRTGIQCWDEPPPCAPVLDPELTPRGPTPGAGFQMVHGVHGTVPSLGVRPRVPS